MNCVNNKETSQCLFVYAVLNNREDLCDYFPESRVVVVGDKYGSSETTYYYKDTCIGTVRMFADYVNAKDKINYCNSLDMAKESCIVYNALISDDENLCILATKGAYGCIISVSCRDFPEKSVEAYKCKLRACEITDLGSGCKDSLNTLYSQWLDESDLEN